MTPEQYEDYSEPYTLAGGQYPEKGKLIEAKDVRTPTEDKPMVSITVTKTDGSKSITVC